MYKFNARLLLLCLSMGVSLLLSTGTRAEVVQVSLPNKLAVLADYRAGQTDKPAVILLHGFLQTRLALPMSGLAQTLAAAGYTVLVPTLSGGYHLRNQTLACEAAHNQGISTDSDELGFWVDWLAQRTRQPITLIGHSSGANVVLRYVSAQPSRRVQQAILVSIVPTQSNLDEYQRTLKKPESHNLARYTIAYCQHSYVTTRAHYLSYAAWNEDMIIRALRQSKVPVSVLVGDEDKVFPAGWRTRLQNDYPATVVVAGAGHFFDGTAELDLSDFVLNQLTLLR